MNATQNPTTAELLTAYLGEDATLIAYRRITADGDDRRYAVAFQSARLSGLVGAGIVDLDDFRDAPAVQSPEVLGGGSTIDIRIGHTLERLQRLNRTVQA